MESVTSTFELNVLFSSCSVSTGPALLEDVLCEPSQSIIAVPKQGTFFVWTVAVQQNANWGLETAVQHCLQFFHNRRAKSTSFFFIPPQEEGMKGSSSAIFVCISSQSDIAVDSIALSTTDRTLIEQAWRENNSSVYKIGSSLIDKLGNVRKRVIYLTLAATALAGIALWFISSITPANASVWQRYDTRGSNGPRYQLQFSHHNVSSWASTNPHTEGEWFLRIDDQAMVPSQLIDDDEMHYQNWFQQRYPEANQIRLNEDYLSEEFLSNPSAIQVPADKTFHMAHCVLAVRRYWKARETGQHVCPRDIDYKHVKHCLDALEMWAFPEGPGGSGAQHGAVSVVDDTRLVWRTKVCF